jgi:hypothetical protein
MKNIIQLLIYILISNAIIAQNSGLELKKAEDVNKIVPEKLLPDIVSTELGYEFGSAFNKIYNKLYFGVRLNKEWQAEIRFSEKIENVWSKPQKLNLPDKYTYNDPFLTESENNLYFVSNQPLKGTGEPKDFDIWFMEKTENGWSKPINAGQIINSEKDEFYVSISDNGTMYFVSNSHTKTEEDKWNFDIYYSEYQNNEYSKPITLSPVVNSDYFECDPFISNDESYLIFCSSKPGGYGEGDLYISFKNTKNEWNEPINMGEIINTEFHEFCPQVTKDGKFLLYTSNGNLYKVSTEIIKKLEMQ